MKCKNCGSYAINHSNHGRDGSDGDLCDVCFWRTRAERLRDAADRCYRMLLTEPDTQCALFKAENILREAGAK